MLTYKFKNSIVTMSVVFLRNWMEIQSTFESDYEESTGLIQTKDVLARTREFIATKTQYYSQC